MTDDKKDTAAVWIVTAALLLIFLICCSTCTGTIECGFHSRPNTPKETGR